MKRILADLIRSYLPDPRYSRSIFVRLNGFQN